MMKFWLIAITVVLIFVLIYLVYLLREINNFNRQLAFIDKNKATNQQITFRSRNRGLIKTGTYINQLIEHRQQLSQQYSQSQAQLDLAIHNISHDLRTPLTIASGYTQMLLKNNDLSVDEQQQLEHIDQNLVRLTKNLDMLLLYNRLLENRIDVNLKDDNLSAFVQQSVLSTYDALTAKDMNVQLAIQPKITWQYDPEILGRVIQNILGNVLDHGTESVKIELIGDASQVVLAVENQLYKPIKNPEKLRDKFYMEDLSRKRENAGLGLYIIYELVALLNGTVEIQTGGLRFKIIITLKKNA